MGKEDKLPDEAKIISLKAGKRYSLCTCGHSKCLPFCDDAHKRVNEEKGTNYRSLKILPKTDVEIEVHSSTWQ